MKIKEAIFDSLVTKQTGHRVAYPGKAYDHMIIMPDTRYTLPISFKCYTQQLKFIKEVDSGFDTDSEEIEKFVPKIAEPEPETEKFKGDIKEIEDAFNKKFEDLIKKQEEAFKEKLKEQQKSEKIEEKPHNLDALPKRENKEAYTQLQDLAYDMHEATSEAGLSNLGSMTIAELFEFCKKERGLFVKYDPKKSANTFPKKAEWISIAMFGFTDHADRKVGKKDTKKWATRWYIKKEIEKVFKSNGEQMPPDMQVKELFSYIWDQGWLARDPWIDTPRGE